LDRYPTLGVDYLESILQAVTSFITNGIHAMGYWGIVLMMGIESACIPLPSEIIMPYGGYMVYKFPAEFSVWWMGVAGAAGCVWGSVLAYYAGRYGGRPLVEKYGKYVLVRKKDLDKADEWFTKHEESAIFFSRLMPVVRTFISFPAGIARVHLGKFILYTFLGSLPWCLMLAYLGQILGEQWDTKLKPYFHDAHIVIGIALLVMIGLYIYHHIKSGKEYEEKG
jgi:membrane protein DedA with SNARE-associated domain